MGALGVNFDYSVVQPEGHDFSSYDRALLGSGGYKLLGEFSSEDARFGQYLSKDHGEARLKLDIKPVTGREDNRERLLFSFNFHHDVAGLEPPERTEKLVELIGTWDSLRQYAQQLVDIGGELQERK